MIVYRITKSPYRKDLSGMGAKLYGGRWNSKGIPLIYCSESRALAYAEVAIHLPLHLDISIVAVCISSCWAKI